ncbi:MAG: hypothetical protein R3261_01300 [Alphaproteobacteria bacterium]|nr:hypothetical protein [Alphaproteobacteria bacterium]
MPLRFSEPFVMPLNQNGQPMPGAKLFFYETGTSTPKNTYSDSTLNIPNANPLIADGDGRFGSVFFDVGDYKVVLKDALDQVIYSADPVAPDPTALFRVDQNLSEIMDTALARNNLGFNEAITLQKAKRGNIVTLTDQATIAADFDLANMFSVTLADNRILDNPSNLVAGQSGCIFISQDATGSRTLSFGSFWKFPEAEPPTLSTIADAVDRLDYVVKSATEIHAVLSKGLA